MACGILVPNQDGTHAVCIGRHSTTGAPGSVEGEVRKELLLGVDGQEKN